MGYGEFDPDIDRTLRVGGRRFVEREGRGEFLRPTYGSDGGGDRPPGSRSLALKLVLMAVVMLALLVAIIVIFT